MSSSTNLMQNASSKFTAKIIVNKLESVVEQRQKNQDKHGFKELQNKILTLEEENRELMIENAELVKKSEVNAKSMQSSKTEINELRKRKMRDTQELTKLTKEIQGLRV